MKAELPHDDYCVSLMVQDCINTIEYEMEHISMRDPEFANLSKQKHAMDQLIIEFGEHPEVPAETVVENFIAKMSQYTGKNSKTDDVFEIARDAAQSIIDALYFMEQF